MKSKTIINVLKVGFVAIYVVPPVINGATAITETAFKLLRNGINNSEHIKNIKKDFELRREGVHTVKYQEV